MNYLQRRRLCFACWREMPGEFTCDHGTAYHIECWERVLIADLITNLPPHVQPMITHAIQEEVA